VIKGKWRIDNDSMKYRLNEENSVKMFEFILSKITINTVYLYNIQNIDNKLLFFINLVLLDILYDKDFAKKKHYLTHMCFEFNEGRSAVL